MSRHLVEEVRCTRITRQAYVLEVQYSGEKQPVSVEKSFTELTDFRTTVVEETKTARDISVPDVKGVRWFESKKDEKKKKAVDEFFQHILQLPLSKDTLSKFLQCSSTSNNNSSVEDKSTNPRPITFEESALGQYEDINNFREMSQSVVVQEYENKPADTNLYAPVVKKNSTVRAKVSPLPVLPMRPVPDKQGADDVVAYEEIPASIKQIVKSMDSANKEEMEDLPPQMLPSPEVPPKIGLSLTPRDESTNTADNTIQTPLLAADKMTSSTETPPLTPLSPAIPVKAVPPMPTFAPPSIVSPTDLPDSVKSVADQTDINIVSIADYTSPSDNVLSFTRGNLASLVVQTDNSWWCIKLGNNCGWVPADYWRKINPDSDCASLSTKAGAPWFVGKLTRNECEALLMEHGEQQHFVVRESTNLVGHYALSVKYNDRVHHFPIELTADKKYYIGKHHFKTVNSIISYYRKNALFYDDNEQGVTLGGNPLVIVRK